MNSASGIGAFGLSWWTGRMLAPASLVAVLLAGCTTMGGPAAPAPAVPAVAARPMDPLVAFAAAASPGSETTVTLAETGRNTRLRLVRAYNAASGRQCREVLIGTGAEERSRVVCEADGQWAAARPLLRGSGPQRP